MSNGSTPSPPRRLRGTLLVVVAAVAVVGLGGWLVWRSAGAGGEPPRTGGISGHGSGHGPAGEDGGHGSRAGEADEKHHAGLRGKVVVIDPGHNPHNNEHGREIARQVDIGNDRKECDTTGTSTNDGYAEASFTLDVARRARTLLQKAGAKVVFTQDGDRPYGPCVDKRAALGNAAHADAALSIHADGAGAGDRGFHVILPARVTDGPADTAAIVAPSRKLGERLADRFHTVTGSPRSNYIGHGTGLDVRSDLGGLNLSTVPKVFLECGNMRDPKDAAQLTDARWRQKAARGITEGITDFLAH
ncbi:N-acetylmuramoyl-L-alanine amidase [Streptomyces sp. CA2R101]|uniref:N-acetylmuramoyl-L-alanine amidase n=1 Tax=Streptomyces sp. CA2R101 TaxID=3120152 RepID=UPI00300B3143